MARGIAGARRLCSGIPGLALAEAAATSGFAVPGGGLWLVEAFFAKAPDGPRLQGQIDRLAGSLALAPPSLTLDRVPPRDWLAEVERQSSPVVAGRFLVHGRHDRGRWPAGGWAIEIDPGRAFGTGRHDSTRGCLLALDRLARRRRIRRSLDLGCGSGILAIAAIKLWRAPTLASDIDPLAAAETLRNARANAARPWLRTLTANGFRHAVLMRCRHDLIVANILAGPLVKLAPELVRRLAPGGRAVLSGILSRQASGVLAAYLRRGLRLERRLQLGDWPTLVLRRGPGIMPRP